jgi:hypothetical protein
MSAKKYNFSIQNKNNMQIYIEKKNKKTVREKKGSAAGACVKKHWPHHSRAKRDSVLF